MPLNTFHCKKHGGHVEEKCPECAREEYNGAVERTVDFFERHGKDRITLKSKNKEDTITVEGLFQYFRMRIVHELNQE